MNRKLLSKYLFFVFFTIYFVQSIFAQKFVGLNTEVKISISKKIGISINKEIPSHQSYTSSSRMKLPKRDILINYNTYEISLDSFPKYKPTLNIFRKKNNSLTSLSTGKEKELNQVMYDDNILISIVENPYSNNFRTKHIVTIVY